jgi:class 3 adenylate cyclase
MRASGWLMHLAKRALAESMDVRSMIHLARRLIQNYDIYKESGFSPNISMPNKDVADQIVRDMKANDLMLDLVIMLIEIHETGLGGRKYRVPYLSEMVNEIKKTGLIYDRESKMFLEDPKIRKTRNWGVLREKQEYIFTFLSVDIVGNSVLVRQNPDEVIQKTYLALRRIVQAAVEKRNGRFWNWEGDGGLVAFYFYNKSVQAVMSAMEILHELYIYNQVYCELNKPLKVRIAVHNGPCEYMHSIEDLKSDTIKKLLDMEARYTKPDSVSISRSVLHMLNQTITHQFDPVNYGANTISYNYKLNLEG